MKSDPSSCTQDAFMWKADSSFDLQDFNDEI